MNASPKASPLLVDLGKQKRKQVKQLRKGKGSLFAEVEQALAQLQAAGEISGEATPVIVLVREKPKKQEPARGRPRLLQNLF